MRSRAERLGRLPHGNPACVPWDVFGLGVNSRRLAYMPIWVRSSVQLAGWGRIDLRSPFSLWAVRSRSRSARTIANEERKALERPSAVE